jgi:hypothetical protein
MSWKPCRGSGLTFDKHTRKSEEYRYKYQQMIESGETCITKLSKAVYWAVKHDISARVSLGGKDHQQTNFICGFFIMQHHIGLFKRNIAKVYKPLLPFLENT